MSPDLLIALVSDEPDVEAFVAGFQTAIWVAIATVVAFGAISFIRKFFG